VKAFVTGGAGFIGSTLTERLAARGDDVTVYDNFSTGEEEFLAPAIATGRVRLVRGDVLDTERLTDAMRGVEVVFHLAANADVRFGTLNPRRDLEQNTIGTFNVLEAMRANNVRRLAFSSTGSVYGDTTVIPTPEDAPFPIQTSLYAASKAAGEAMIQAYCEGYGMNAYIFRFVSILGERYLHGHVFDFCRKLLADPHNLHILGDGNQRKSYLYVADCVSAVLLAVEQSKDRINIFNLGTDEYVTVNQSVGWITETLGVKPELTYEGGTRGWVGDNPFILLDTTRIRALGWRATLSIHEAVVRTVEYLRANQHLLHRDRR
jgi:UDP-glucose 4-epimerase